MKRLAIIPLLAFSLYAGNKGDNIPVKISQNLPYIYTTDSGTKVKIQRIQDTANRLSDDFTKTSRPCPPFCIQPTVPIKGVKNIEELELLKFMKEKVPSKKGLVVDARLKSWYELETIPGAVNIPFVIAQSKNPKTIARLFKILGAKQKADGTFDFTNAKELAVFCNGVWCGQSPTFIRGLVKNGYPKNKIYYYRSGFQGWKLLGLTTAIHKAVEAK